MPVVVFAVLLTGNLLAFPLSYGMLGPWKRTPFPSGKPALIARGSWGRLGWWLAGTYGTFSYYVYPSGLGISIVGVGKVFIPVESITRLEIGSSWGGYEMTHTSPEVRGPVRIGSTPVYEVLKEIRRKYRESVSGAREIGEKIAEVLGAPAPRIRFFETHHVMVRFVFPAPSGFPEEEKLDAVAHEAARLLSERDPHFRAEEHLTIRFVYGERTLARWRNGKLEMLGEEPDNVSEGT